MRALFFCAALMLLAGEACAEPSWFGLPIACEPGKDCWVQQYPDHDPSPAAQDYMCGAESYDGHDGTDIRIRDTTSSADVTASAAGTVKGVRDGMADRLVRTDEDKQAIKDRECGNGVVLDQGGGWETQYCHMRKGSVAVKAGDTVAAGQRLGKVGYSGLAAFPHVHLTVRKAGKAIDPFRQDAATCGGLADPVWSTETLSRLSYARGNVIRSGFAPGAIDLKDLENGSLADISPARDWPALVAYGWAINLEAGDTIRISLRGPDGLSAEQETALDRAKAQYMLFSGKKRPAAGWPAGVYEGRIDILKDGAMRVSQSWQVTLD